MPNILFASDIDGTLAKRLHIPSENIKAIKKFREAGNYFAVVTGRNKSMIHKNVFPLCDYTIADTGAVIFDGNKIIYECPLDKQEVDRILEVVRSSDADNVIVHGKDTYCIESLDKSTRFKNFITKFALYGVPTDIEQIIKDNVYEISIQFLKGNKCFKNVTDRLKQIDGISVYENTYSIDVVSNKTNKADGIRKLSEYKHFDKIVVMGDQMNDELMIKEFESYAMESGNPILKQSAKHISPSVAMAIQEVMASDL